MPFDGLAVANCARIIFFCRTIVARLREIKSGGCFWCNYKFNYEVKIKLKIIDYKLIKEIKYINY